MYKVLLVEDEDIIREGLKYMVDWVGVDCVVVGEARNGFEGMEQIEKCSPDIVILDVNMPLINGIEMLDGMEGNTFFSTIILSGYDEFEYARKAIAHEVVDYLLKPVDYTELYQAIQKAKELLDRKKNHHYLEKKAIDVREMNVLKSDLLLPSHKTTKTVAKMIQFVEENYSDKISIADLVDELELSATYLNKKFKEETSHTFNDFLNRYRIQKAIQLISKKESKISMIATEVGYSNYQYFIKVFKKYTNTLPSDFSKYW